MVLASVGHSDETHRAHIAAQNLPLCDPGRQGGRAVGQGDTWQEAEAKRRGSSSIPAHLLPCRLSWKWEASCLQPGESDIFPGTWRQVRRALPGSGEGESGLCHLCHFSSAELCEQAGEEAWQAQAKPKSSLQSHSVVPSCSSFQKICSGCHWQSPSKSFQMLLQKVGLSPGGGALPKPLPHGGLHLLPTLPFSRW